MAREPMPTHNYRVPDDVWNDAIATAQAAGESWAATLREFTEWYAHRPRAREPWRPEVGVKAEQAGTATDGKQ